MTRGKETDYPECRKKDRPILSGIQANALLRRNAWPYGRQIKDLESIKGIRGISTEIGTTGNLQSLSMRVEKELDLALVLRLLSGSGLVIRSVNTEEPTLEDAFNLITGRDERRGPRRMAGGF